MVAAREKGKIARSEWATIVARYRAGDTIAQIGRDYGCTGPAIRYIIKRADAAPEAPGTRKKDAAAAGPSQGAPGAPDSPAAAPPPARLGRAHPPGATLGAELRDRVSSDVASFLVALDQLASERSAASAAELQEATDRLMRSAARIRIEVERLLAEEPARATASRMLSSLRRA